MKGAKDAVSIGSKPKRPLVLLAIVLLVSAAAWMGIAAALNSVAPFSVVSGGSMRPTLYAGDVVVLDAVPFNKLKVGDIIVFRAPVYNQEGSCRVVLEGIPCYVVHRIVQISNSSGIPLLETKGDNNPTSENGVDCLVGSSGQCSPAITESDYVGKVVYCLPYLGVLDFAVPRPFNYAILAVLVITIVLVEVVLGREAKSPRSKPDAFPEIKP